MHSSPRPKGDRQAAAKTRTRRSGRRSATETRHKPPANPTSGHGPAVDGGAVDAQADQDAQEFVAMADLAVPVGVAWALKS
jgi:hypothetical protein